MVLIPRSIETKAISKLVKVLRLLVSPYFVLNSRITNPLCEKCPNTEFFLARIFPYSVRIRENTNQKKLHI